MSKGYAVVTGAGRSIGAALARQLGKEGYDVLINYSSSSQKAEEVAQSISQDFGVKAVTFKASVEDYNQVKEMRDFAVETFGEKMVVLVNNAGIMNRKKFVDMEPDEYARVIGVDLFGTLNCCNLFVPLMIKQNFGRVITIASTAGLRGSIDQSDYCAAKGAQIAFTRAVALEWGQYNITANVIAPGFIMTEGTAELGPQLEARIRSQSPLGQVGSVDDMAQALSYLINSDIMTGQTISPNCGVFMF